MPQQQIDRLKRLHQLSLLVTEDYQTLYQAFLTAGVESLGLSLGIVSRIQGNDFEVLAAFPAQGNIRPGAHFPLGETYCHQVMRDDASIAVHRVAEDARFQSHPVYINLGVEAYISAPIHVKGEIFGTLNFSDTQPRAEPFSDEDVEFLELMAQSLGSQLERDLLEKERREAVRRMEENIALFEGSFQYSAVGMGIVSTDGKWLRVNQALCDLVGYRAAELVGKDFQSLTHPEDREEDRDCFNALVRDERQITCGKNVISTATAPWCGSNW